MENNAEDNGKSTGSFGKRGGNRDDYPDSDPRPSVITDMAQSASR